MMSVSLSVCLNIWIYVYVCVHVCNIPWVNYINMYNCPCVYVWSLYMYVYMYMLVCMYVCMLTCMHVHTFSYLYACMAECLLIILFTEIFGYFFLFILFICVLTVVSCWPELECAQAQVSVFVGWVQLLQ